MGKIGRNIKAKKKDGKRVVYMVMDQKARKAVEEVDSCHYILSSQKTENLMLLIHFEDVHLANFTRKTMFRIFLNFSSNLFCRNSEF